jgi:hypothetical protein
MEVVLMARGPILVRVEVKDFEREMVRSMAGWMIVRERRGEG